MGDMGDNFRTIKKHSKERKATNMKSNLDYLNSLNMAYEVCNKGYQLNFYHSFGIVTFYPSTNKWILGNKVYYGTAINFVNWLEEKRKGIPWETQQMSMK